MDYPMRKYGTNVFELALSFWLGLTSWLCLLLAIAGFIFRPVFFARPWVAGFAIASLLLCFILLGLWSAGLRQNKFIKDAALLCYLLTGLLLTISGAVDAVLASILAGAAILLLFALLCVLQYQATRIRFKPRFFSLRQFQTMIQIADTMMDTDGRQVLNPIEVALSTDHMFALISSPAAIKEIKLVLLLVEWVLPLLSLRPFPFSDLGTMERRALVQKTIGAKGLLQNIAKVMKLFANAGYYGNPRGMAQVGYVPFNDRPVVKEALKNNPDYEKPIVYKDPFQPGGKLYGKV